MMIHFPRPDGSQGTFEPIEFPQVTEAGPTEWTALAGIEKALKTDPAFMQNMRHATDTLPDGLQFPNEKEV